MKCDQVYNILNTLEEGKRIDIDEDTASYLQEKGLLSLLTRREYNRMQIGLRDLPSIEQDRQYYTNKCNQYSKEINGLKNKEDSRWHKFWSPKEKEDIEKRRLSNIEIRYKEMVNEVIKAEKEITRLNEMKDSLVGYIRIPKGHVRLTKLGTKRKKELSARLSRLNEVSYDKFEQEYKQIWESIESRFNKFKKMYEFMQENGFKKDAKVANCALSLSMLESTVEEVYERAMVINDYLYEKNWKSYDRLKIVSIVAAQEGDINQLKDHLIKIYVLMTENDHSSSYSTWSEAATVMKIDGKDAKAKYERFDKIGDELSKRDWKKNSAASCYISTNLAKKRGNVEDIAQEFRDLELKIVERGRNDCIESGIASLILMDSKKPLDEKADRFNETFEMMVKYKWSKSSKNYPTAAVLSLMPGTIEENVQLLEDVYKMQKDGGFHNDLTQRSIALISGGFKDIFKQRNIHTATAFIDEGTAIIDSDCDSFFDTGWAIAGDLIDNGNLDLSDGFFAGGILGGLLDD